MTVNRLSTVTRTIQNRKARKRRATLQTLTPLTVLHIVLTGGVFVLRNLAFQETAHRQVRLHRDNTTGQEWVPWGPCTYAALLAAAQQQACE